MEPSVLIVLERGQKAGLTVWLDAGDLKAKGQPTSQAKAVYRIDIASLVLEKSVVELGYPVFVIHGIADDRIPWEHGQRVAAAAEEGSSLWLLLGVDHLDAFLTHPDGYVERVNDYFESRLR